MTVRYYCVKEYEKDSGIITRVKRIWEATNNVGTFYTIEQESGQMTSVWKNRVERIEITA